MSIRIVIVDPQGRETAIPARPGDSLMRAAVGAGIDGIAADCGGCLSCATCHVYVDDNALGRLAPPSKDEDAMLEMTASPRQPNSRLSCQIALDESMDGLRVTLPASQY